MTFLNRHLNFIQLLKRIGVYLLLMQITRILFFAFNQSIFESYGFSEIIGGIWFDLVTFCLLGFPYIALQSLPFPFTYRRGYQFFLAGLFYAICGGCIALNLIDTEYYKFSHKRSTSDLFSILSAGDDIQQEMNSFFRDFWYILLLFILLLALAVFISKKWIRIPKFSGYRNEIIQFVLILTFAIFVGRGGFSLRPISVIDASYFTNPEKIGLVLNTPFTMLKSYGKSTLTNPYFFSKEKSNQILNPIQTSSPQTILPEKTNVVIVLLESFGAEFVGAAGAKNSFTPFLDSIAENSLNFKYGIANGKRSIEALPSIYASIPTWMDEAYITSPYNSNKVISLAKILDQNGYETAFFHGATNGSMKFDAFTQQMGVQHYFGRTEYANDADFDGTWGIKDDKFLPWSIQKMNEFKEPFFSTIFTLSSHHPYFIPKEWKGKLKKGKHPIAATINYTDESLRIFMNEARKQKWYKNTIFIFLADHTPMPTTPKYASSIETYHIPILIFDPQKHIEPRQSNQYFQQIDLFPTLLDLLNIKTNFYAFGSSYFKHRNEGMAYGESTYYYFFNDYLLTFQNRKPRKLVRVKTKQTNYKDSSAYYPTEIRNATQRIKAFIQHYNDDLTKNQTHVK